MLLSQIVASCEDKYCGATVTNCTEEDKIIFVANLNSTAVHWFLDVLELWIKGEKSEISFLTLSPESLREGVSIGRHLEAAHRRNEAIGGEYFDCLWSAVYRRIPAKCRPVMAKLG